jgi:hypothetical protein
MQNLIYDAAQVRINEFRREIADVVLDPDRWLITPHDLLGARTHRFAQYRQRRR